MSATGTAGESIAYRVIIASILGPVFAMPLCAIRIYTKLYVLRNTGYDDYAVFIATFLALGFSITTICQTNNGLGLHMSDVSALQFHNLMKVGGIAGPLFFNLASMCTKLSLCFFYLRFSISRGFHIAIYTLMAVCIGYSVLAAFGFVWVCQPKEKYWDYTITGGSCVNFDALFLSTACINAATDFVLLILPLFIIKDLSLPKRRKVGVTLLLMTGSFVFVVSLIRTEAIVRGMGQVATDASFGMVQNFIWILVEMWLGIICTCIPTLHTFIKSQYAGRSAKPNANIRDNRMPNHEWIGLEDTPEKTSSGAKQFSRADIPDSKSHGSNSTVSRTISSHQYDFRIQAGINLSGCRDNEVDYDTSFYTGRVLESIRDTAT